MWRTQMGHKKNETEFLTDVIDRVAGDRNFLREANAILHAEAQLEPLFVDALRTPQTPKYHAEGPFVVDHLRTMLCVLIAVVKDQIHLTNIEEFARMKGFEGEVEEIEETIKENSALFETFILCHDAAKWACVYFDAPPSSRGHSLGFIEDTFAHREDIGISERAKFRTRFLDLYQAFQSEHQSLSLSEIQTQFYLTYGIDVHYASHDRMIHTPVYRQLLERMAQRRQLSTRDNDVLETLVAHHLDPVKDFSVTRPHVFSRYVALARKIGFDSDDFIDLLQGCLFLDTVSGSKQLTVGGSHYNASVLTNFLRSEHDFDPKRRQEKDDVREQQRVRERNAIFREVGLDGIALMDVLNMEAGPQFGQVLRRIHEAIVSGNPLPRFNNQIDLELARRVDAYYQKIYIS